MLVQLKRFMALNGVIDNGGYSFFSHFNEPPILWKQNRNRNCAGMIDDESRSVVFQLIIVFDCNVLLQNSVKIKAA